MVSFKKFMNMKEFIFTWNIENISYSWHKRGTGITSPYFVADTLKNTVWKLALYPRGYSIANWLGLYLYGDEDNGTRDFLVQFEFSCVSANNLKLPPLVGEFVPAGLRGIWKARFVEVHEIFLRRKSLYLQQDSLTLRCRMWTTEGDVDKYGQSFGSTRIEIERILSVRNINPGISGKETFEMHSKRNNVALALVTTTDDGSSLEIETDLVNVHHIITSSWNLHAEGRKRKQIPCEHLISWLHSSNRKIWRLLYPSEVLDTRNKDIGSNKLKLTLEFTYATGKETILIETVPPCLYKFPEFSSYNIISCIPSGKLSDCPNICKDLWNLYVKRILCDVELKTQTTSLWVHKIVLCARSPVFLAMFNYDTMEKTNQCVEIQDLEDSTLKKFVAFLYTDHFDTEFQWDALLDLYYSADKYQVERLKILCCFYLMKNIEASKVCDLLMLSDRHNDSALRSQVEDYILRHHTEIFKSQMWRQFCNEHPRMTVKTMLCKYDNARGNANPSEKYKLSCYPNAMDDFRSLYQCQITSDIVIKTTTATFPAHKTVLCSASSLIRMMFESGKSTDSLKIEDLEDDTVSHILLFLYTDSLGNIEWETATKLYHAAIAYKIQRLKIKCSCFFLEYIQPSNASNLLLLAHMHLDVKFERLLKDYLSLHDKKIIDYQGWVKCSKKSADGQDRPPKRARLT